LPWALIIIVIVIALIVALDMVGDDPVQTSSAGDTGVVTTPDENSETDGPKPEKKPDESKPKASRQKEKPERDPTDEPKGLQTRLITKGVTVQVLNGTGDGEADDLMADRLARLGFTVVAVSPSSKSYPSTTVFWVGDAEEAGGLLADRFGWKLDSAPANLSEEVGLHIVVGEDAL
jgi:hypothetical protein